MFFELWLYKAWKIQYIGSISSRSWSITIPFVPSSYSWWHVSKSFNGFFFNLSLFSVYIYQKCILKYFTIWISAVVEMHGDTMLFNPRAPSKKLKKNRAPQIIIEMTSSPLSLFYSPSSPLLYLPSELTLSEWKTVCQKSALHHRVNLYIN